MNDSGATEEKRRGRRAQTPDEMLARARDMMTKATRAKKALERLKFETIGEAVLAEAMHDAELMARVRALLDKRVTQKAGREAVAPLLIA